MSDAHSALERIGPGLALLAAILGLLAAAAQAASAQSEIVLYSFTGGADGAYPCAALVRDTKGNLYSTTWVGGADDQGTVFEVTPSGTERVLHSFAAGADGAEPCAALVRDTEGNLYGTTYLGGFFGGTVFKVTPTGTETVLYSFAGEPDGANPYAALVDDTEGNLYGTTIFGGVSDYGTVFELTPTGEEKVLYSFGGAHGENSYAALLQDGQGNLYGTTYFGGAHGHGTVFEVTRTGTEKVLHSFAAGADGAGPFAGLVRDTAGNLYGTTIFGGTSGHGTVFKITPTGEEKVLHSFGAEPDGANPYALLVLDEQGNLYGTTYAGGAHGQGTVFEVTKTGTEKVLYSFGGTHGANPYAALVRDTQGNLYGTTYAGGAHGQGTVFKLTP